MPEDRERALILIVDDQEQNRYIFRRILTRAGFRVEEASTGSEGLRKAMLAPDIIIADVNLPDMLGFELSRRLKADPSTSGTPILQISASFVSDESKVQALQGGADSYLIQPVEAAVLLAQVQALLRLKEAETSSRLLSQQWQTTFDSLTDGLALVAPDGAIVRVNQAFLEVSGLTWSDAQGQSVAQVFQAIFGVPFHETLLEKTAGERLDLQVQGRWISARYEDVVRGEPAANQGGVLLLTDITEHKKLQETLKMSERVAATGRLAHIIAHEINNPLEAISNLLFLIQHSDSVDEEARRYADQALSELHRVAEITKEILTYHRESKHPVRVSAAGTLEGVLAIFRSRMIGTQVQLEKSFRSSRSIYAHPGELRQACGNLIANALDAIGAEAGILRIRCLDATDIPSQMRGVRFIFSDSGGGIPKDAHANIFRPFFTTKGAGGSGIGLWLTSEITAKHQGRVRMRSRTDGKYRGTLFDVFLPAIDD